MNCVQRGALDALHTIVDPQRHVAGTDPLQKWECGNVGILERVAIPLGNSRISSSLRLGLRLFAARRSSPYDLPARIRNRDSLLFQAYPDESRKIGIQ